MRFLLAFLFAALFAATLASCTDDGGAIAAGPVFDDNAWGPPPDDESWDDDDAAVVPDEPLPRLTAKTWPRRAIYDSFGREVLLRGVNFNHLGDYWQIDPSLPTVADLGADDWDDAAAMGMSVIRLVTSWSAWEPERGRLDGDYLARVRDAVAEANARQMYVVIDMHQDAWSRFVFTPADETCPEGTSHQKGWDGAPAWATFTDDEPTCNPGRREESPAVVRAWDNFYADRDGVRTALVLTWAKIAAEFAGESGVAGFDLLNEPGNGSNLGGTVAGLTAFYREAITAIREAEAETGSPGHIVFFEPSVTGYPVGFDLGSDNLCFAIHNYVESIGPSVPGLLEVSFPAYDLYARLYDAPIWIGEYNHFGSREDSEAWTARYAVQEDRHLFSGGTWWQWEQECGDPHNAQYPPTSEWLDQQRVRCGDARFVPSTCLSRAYPRAAPGSLAELSAAPCGEGLRLSGATGTPSTADLWFPSESDDPPPVSGTGIADVRPRRVDGGWRIEVDVAGAYAIEVTPSLQ